eukprot:TRINITY_DN21821_c0_g1_i1.p1 TRINITY_DN21821_c0_g1~~TRINITY_DN21821_c0_g1_i1.p1  ORF type:complete len:374 (+),score=46.56 TRINITY_DN21821_c0_g1_i1:64-1185(+)
MIGSFGTSLFRTALRGLNHESDDAFEEELKSALAASLEETPTRAVIEETGDSFQGKWVCHTGNTREPGPSPSYGVDCPSTRSRIHSEPLTYTRFSDRDGQGVGGGLQRGAMPLRRARTQPFCTSNGSGALPPSSHSRAPGRPIVSKGSSSASPVPKQSGCDDLSGRPMQGSRIGVDVGGVLTKCKHERPEGHWEDQLGYAAVGAVNGLARLIQIFGADNVFIVSKVRLGSAMQQKIEHWLHETIRVCERTGLRKENIYFCEEATGPTGKGVVAQKLCLSHFVDDRFDVLQSVLSDPCGNSGNEVRAKRGQLFHFMHGRLVDPGEMSKEMRTYYSSVPSWPVLLGNFHCPVADAGKSEAGRELFRAALQKLSGV